MYAVQNIVYYRILSKHQRVLQNNLLKKLDVPVTRTTYFGQKAFSKKRIEKLNAQIY